MWMDDVLMNAIYTCGWMNTIYNCGLMNALLPNCLSECYQYLRMDKCPAAQFVLMNAIYT